MIEDQHLDEDARNAIATGESIVREVRGEDGRLFERHVKPYEADIGGVVVTYFPVSSSPESSIELPLGLELKPRMASVGAFAPDSVIQSLTLGVSQIGVWTLQAASWRMDWDEPFAQLTGLATPNLPLEQAGFVENVHEDDRGSFERSLKAVIEGGEPQDIELRYCPSEQETIWLQVRSVRVDHAGSPLIVGIVADITERKGDKERSDFMMRELDHRVKNLLAIILSIAEITARSNDDIGTYKNDFRARLESMARTHNLLAQTQWSGLDLRMLVEEELFNTATRDAVTIEGESLIISPAAAQSLAMFLHELVVNAVKHGALLHDEGHLKVRWESDGATASDLRLIWEETGGPKVAEPTREGFGGKVINRIVKRQLDAKVRTNWDSAGIKLVAEIPLANLARPKQPDGS